MITTKFFSPALRRITTVVLLAGTLAMAGCGSSTKTVSSTGANGQVTTQTVPNVYFAKTKFVLHAGLAFGAIDRYIYKPLRAGALHNGAPGAREGAAQRGGGGHVRRARAEAGPQ